MHDLAGRDGRPAREEPVAVEVLGQQRFEFVPVFGLEPLRDRPFAPEHRQLDLAQTVRLRPGIDRRYGDGQREPDEPVRAEGQEVRLVRDLRKPRAAEHLLGDDARVVLQVQLDVLDEPRQVGNHQDALILVLADERQDLGIVGTQQTERAPAEGPERLAQGDQPLDPPQERRRVALLRLDVHRLVVVLRIDDDRQVKLLRVGSAEPGVAVGRPLHRRAHPVAVAEVDVVPHADLVAVVEDRRSRQREQQSEHQLDAAPVVAQQRGQPVADAQVDAAHDGPRA